MKKTREKPPRTIKGGMHRGREVSEKTSSLRLEIGTRTQSVRGKRPTKSHSTISRNSGGGLKHKPEGTPDARGEGTQGAACPIRSMSSRGV